VHQVARKVGANFAGRVVCHLSLSAKWARYCPGAVYHESPQSKYRGQAGRTQCVAAQIAIGPDVLFR
jgi:hypothetical protein